MIEDPDGLVAQFKTNVDACSKKTNRVACLPLLRSLSCFTVEYAPFGQLSLVFDGCLKLAAALKSSSSNSEENKVIRIVHYFLARTAHTAPAAAVQNGIRVLIGTELVDKNLPRQLSVLATVAILNKIAVQGEMVSDSKMTWTALEPWSKALHDASSPKTAAKAKMDKKDVAHALVTGPVVMAAVATCVQVDTSVSETLVMRLIEGLAASAPDTARQSAHALLAATRVVLQCTPCVECGRSSAPATPCCAPDVLAAALVACFESGSSGSSSAAGSPTTNFGFNSADDTTVKLVCRIIQHLVCGYSVPVTIAGEDSLAAAVVDQYFGYYSTADMSARVAMRNHATQVPLVVQDSTISPPAVLKHSLPILACGHIPAAGVTTGQADALLRWLVTCVQCDNRSISLEAIRTLVNIGWDAVLAVPSALEAILSQLLETLRGIIMRTSQGKTSSASELLSACRAVVSLGESFVMWSVGHSHDEISLAACKSYADGIASLIPMLVHFSQFTLGWRNKLVLLRAMVWALPSPRFGRVEADPRVAALIQEVQNALQRPVEPEITLQQVVAMLSSRVVFTQDLLPVLVSLPLAWCQRDPISVPPSVCDGLWDFCCALGRPGRVAALSCMHGLLDSRPCDDGPVMAHWKELSDSVLTYMGRHASALCGLPRSGSESTDTQLPSAVRSLAARIFAAGLVADSSRTKETCIQALQTMGPHASAAEKAVLLHQLHMETRG